MTGLLVIVPVEGEPILIIDALNDSQEARLHDWLRHSLVLVRVAADLLALQRELIEAEDDEPEEAA